MERVEKIELMNEKFFDDQRKMENIIKADPNFYDRFRSEWEEITATLKEIDRLNKLKAENKVNNKKAYKPSSSSAVFR